MTNKPREIAQLILAAHNFFELASDIWSDLAEAEKDLSNADISSRFESLGWSQKDATLVKLNSYLASCAIRISTIYEITQLKPKMKTHYAQKAPNNKDYICHYLRDNVCHREPEDDEQAWVKRQNFLDKLTIRESYESIEQAIKNCRSDLANLETEGHLINQ